MKRILSKFLVVAMLLSSIVSASATPTISSEGAATSSTQVTAKEIAGKWYETAMQYAISSGALSGYSDGSYRPEANITRGAMAIILQRLFGYTATAGQAEFSDVPYTSAYRVGVMATAANGVITGFEDGTFKPTANITRQQTAVMLARALGAKTSSTPVLTFVDSSAVADYAIPAVAYMKTMSYMNGNAKNLFRPSDPITRAEAATVLYNARAGIEAAKGVDTTTDLKEAKTYIGSYDNSVRVMAAGTTLKDVTIAGSLYIDKAVGSGDVYLKNVKVTGKVVVNGGGSNSIHYSGNTLKDTIMVVDAASRVRVVCDEGKGSNNQVGTINVTGGAGAILECPAYSVNIERGAGATELRGTVTTVNSATSATVTVAAGASVSGLNLTGTAANLRVDGAVTTVTGDSDTGNSSIYVTGSINTANLAGARSTVQGTGTVNRVTASGNNISVTTKGTSVSATSGTTGVTAGGKAVSAGGSATTPGSSSGSGGSSSSGNSDTSIAVTNVALSETSKYLVVGGQFTLTYSLTPINGTVTSTTWSSSNAAVATCVGGVVKAVAPGTCTISLTLNGITRSCAVTVNVDTNTPIYILNSLRHGTTLTADQIRAAMPSGSPVAVYDDHIISYRLALADGVSDFTSSTLEDLVEDVNFAVAKKFDTLVSEWVANDPTVLDCTGITTEEDLGETILVPYVKEHLASFEESSARYVYVEITSVTWPEVGTEDSPAGLAGNVTFKVVLKSLNSLTLATGIKTFPLAAQPYMGLTAEEAIEQIQTKVKAGEAGTITGALLEMTGATFDPGFSPMHSANLSKYVTVFGAFEAEGKLPAVFTLETIQEIVDAVEHIYLEVPAYIAMVKLRDFKPGFSSTDDMTAFYDALGRDDFVAALTASDGSAAATVALRDRVFSDFVDFGIDPSYDSRLVLSGVVVELMPTATEYGALSVRFEYVTTGASDLGSFKVAVPLTPWEGAEPYEFVEVLCERGRYSSITLDMIKAAVSEEVRPTVIQGNIAKYNDYLRQATIPFSATTVTDIVVDANWLVNYVLAEDPTPIYARLMAAVPETIAESFDPTAFSTREGTEQLMADSVTGAIPGLGGAYSGVLAGKVTYKLLDGDEGYSAPISGANPVDGMCAGKLIFTMPNGHTYSTDTITTTITASTD